MKFSVGTNFKRDLIAKIRKDDVDELYGKLAVDFVGGGRPSYVLPEITKDEIQSHIREIHKCGLKFDYLLNASCLGNREFTLAGQKELHSLLGWLNEIKVDCITVALPYLARLIKKYYPHFKINVSSFADVDSIERARFWEDVGAVMITLSPHKLTRDFSVLKAIRKTVKVKLQLIANLGCLYNCPLSLYHRNLNSHASQAGVRSEDFIVDYCILECNYKRIMSPVDFIRGSWIRPEDTYYYEDIGIDNLKLVGRSMPTDIIITITKAYIERCYKGNLLDILGRRIFKGTLSNRNFLFALNDGIFIDNQALDGFLKHFLEANCRLISCEDCNYCEEVAKRAVKVNPDFQKDILSKYRAILENRISGRFFNM